MLGFREYKTTTIKSIDDMIVEKTKYIENEWDYTIEKSKILELFLILNEIMKNEL